MTLPIAPVGEPVTTSLNWKVPIPDVGEEIVIDGAAVYPIPGSVMYIALTLFDVETTTLAVAVVNPEVT